MRLLTATLLLLAAIAARAAGISGTLPVVYITTDGRQAITSKTDYIDATCYIDAQGLPDAPALGFTGLSDLGSPAAPVPLQIRGRGNYTWSSFTKKPYKLKFTVKTSVLGLTKNKHFALLAHADDKKGFLKNAVAFWLGRTLSVPFTPDFRPVEVVLNDQYIGVYFLTETVRVGKNRINITEQPDYSLDVDEIEGGWLIEIDNYKGPTQVAFPIENTNLKFFYITYHSPENLSAAQQFYLSYQMSCLKDAIYADDKLSENWQKLVDVTSLARYYVIAEITDHLEAFLGSCYLYKDKGTKWTFGTLWDFGHAFNDFHEKQRFIYEGTTYFPHSIIEEVAKYPAFQEEVRRIWAQFYPTHYQALENYIDLYTDYLTAAAAADYQRWPAYGNRYEWACGQLVKTTLDIKTAWLDTQWGATPTALHPMATAAPRRIRTFAADGSAISGVQRGVNIVRTEHADGTVSVRKVVVR